MVDVLGGVVDVDLDPAHATGEATAAGPAIVTDRRRGIRAEVGRLVAGEDHRLRRVDPSLADRLAVDVEGWSCTIFDTGRTSAAHVPRVVDAVADLIRS